MTEDNRILFKFRNLADRCLSGIVWQIAKF